MSGVRFHSLPDQLELVTLICIDYYSKDSHAQAIYESWERQAGA